MNEVMLPDFPMQSSKSLTSMQTRSTFFWPSIHTNVCVSMNISLYIDTDKDKSYTYTGKNTHQHTPT